MANQSKQSTPSEIMQLVSSQIVLAEKQFRSGSRGYWGGGKLVLNGKRYQTQVQLVEIGSKPTE